MVITRGQAQQSHLKHDRQFRHGVKKIPVKVNLLQEVHKIIKIKKSMKKRDLMNSTFLTSLETKWSSWSSPLLPLAARC
jgi:hypothetical protein